MLPITVDKNTSNQINTMKEKKNPYQDNLMTFFFFWQLSNSSQNNSILNLYALVSIEKYFTLK